MAIFEKKGNNFYGQSDAVPDRVMDSNNNRELNAEHVALMFKKLIDHMTILEQRIQDLESHKCKCCGEE